MAELELDLSSLSDAAQEAFVQAREKALDGDDFELRAFAALREYPVSIEEFITSKDFLGSDALYPAVLAALIELNNPVIEGYEHRARLWTPYSEAILTGAIGVGKSTIAIYSMLYQLYVLSCFRSPHTLFGLDPSSEIVIVFQNRTERLAKVVDYDRFKSLVRGSPYFQDKFPFDHKVISELRFPNRIIVKPVSGADTATIGQNIISAVIDEINFMETVERSSRSIDGRTYDQASSLYETIARRRSSRFMKMGRLPGLLCLVSSRRYPGQFTDLKEQERQRQLNETGATSIYLYDKRLWDIKPQGTYCGDTFQVYTGNLANKPRVVRPEDIFDPEDRPLILDIPIEHRPEFDRDILNALRDIAGVSTTAIHPFLMDRDKVASCFQDRPSILNRQETDLTQKELKLYPDRFYKPELIRYAHLDLSMTGDATGIVIGCVEKFVQVERGGLIETLPHMRIDMVLRVLPPRDGEIPFHRIRELLYKLREQGLNIHFVTADSFQSTDMLQTLRRMGFVTGRVSVDRDNVAYEALKAALYDGRVDIPTNQVLLRELLSLEIDAKTEKVDHPPNGGSKDLADALAAVVHGLGNRRETWTQHRVRPYQAAHKLRAKNPSIDAMVLDDT